MKTTKITITSGVYVMINNELKVVYVGESRFCEYRVMDHFNKAFNSEAKEDKDVHFHKYLREHPTGWTWKVLEKINTEYIRKKAEKDFIYLYSKTDYKLLNKQHLPKGYTGE